MSDLDKFYSFQEETIEHVVVYTTRGIERASLPANYIPRLENGEFNFRPGVYSLAFWQRIASNGQNSVQMRDFYKLPEYPNEASRLYALQFPEKKKGFATVEKQSSKCCFF